ncbi:MAG: leucine-rich repeat protein [Bacteroidaceae bacterium]|nr:leucine-rich repeat protein [Bacteroidaceae bacterium]
MKRIKLLLMTITGLLTMSHLAEAYDFKENGIYYNKLSTNNEVEVTFYKDGSSYYKGDVTIPASVTYEGITYAVTGISTRAFYDCKELTSITLPSGLVNIGIGAFSGCTKLISVQIPSTVTSIDDNAFSSCRGLTTVTLSGHLTSIGDYAFMGCSHLTSIVIPGRVTRIGSWAFSACESLASVEIPSSVKTIGSGAFSGCALTSINLPNSISYISRETFRDCTKLTYVSIPSTVSSIYTQAFENCTSLTSILIPEGMKTIGQYVFNKCTGLSSISLPASLESIEQGAFYDCKDLSSITANWQTPPSALKPSGIFYSGYSVSSHAVLAVPYGTKDAYTSAGWTTDVFKGGIVEIAAKINFADIEVKRICVENWDTNGNGELEENEAAAVTDLGNVFTFNKTIQSFDELSYFTNLQCITQRAFNNCTSLSSIVLPCNLKTISEFAFCNCDGLTSISIPQNVESVAVDAFTFCDNLSNVHISDLTVWCNIKFVSTVPISQNYHLYLNGSEIKELVIPNGITTISSGAFGGCCSLTSVIMPSSVETIGTGAFQGCTALSSITIGNNVSTISSHAFEGCNTLEAVTIPKSVTQIGEYAFHHCNNLSEVTVENPVPFSIASGTAFPNRDSITLQVPTGSKVAYETADYWKEFKKIKEFTILGDINGDGVVNIADVTKLVNIILGKE